MNYIADRGLADGFGETLIVKACMSEWSQIRVPVTVVMLVL